jgi:hypothetical protein
MSSGAIVGPGRYSAVEHDDGQQYPLGHVMLDDLGVMSVIDVPQAVDPARRETSRRVAERMNGKPAMYIDVPPPDDAPRGTLMSRGVARGDPAFIPALVDYLWTYYNIELTPE